MVAAAAAASASSSAAASSSGWVAALLPHSVFGAVLYALVLGVTAALYHFRARRLHCAGSDSIPSPGFVLWFGHFLQLQKERARMYDWVSELSNVTYRGKHWQMSVPGSPVAIVAAPSEAVTKMLLKDDFQNWIVSDRRKAWTEELFGQGIFGVNGPEWLRQRKAASSVFTLRLLRDGMTPVFEEHSAVVVSILREAAKTGKAVDLQDLFFRYTMDSFCQIAFGEDVGCLKQPDRPHPFASAFDRVQYGVMTRVFDLLWKVKRVLGVGQEKKMAEDVAIINSYAKVFVQHRRQDLADGKVRDDLISHFMAWAKKEGRDMTDQELRDVIINFLVAGRDTTAVAMSWFFHEMSKNPAALAKVVAEVDALMAEHGTAIANFEVARDMQYTEAALLESLRLHPSVPVEGRMCLREAQLPATATQPAMTLPAGTAVIYHPYTYGRSPELWGPDAGEYKPERWLADANTNGDAAAGGDGSAAAADGENKSSAGVEFNDSTNLKRHSQWKFPTFNAGMRLCMGRGLALHEAKLLIASILHSLTLSLAPNHPAVTYQLTVTLMLKDGIKMVPALRADRPAPAAAAKPAAPTAAAH